MLERWLEGESLATIAADFGISRQAVHKRILRVATPAQRHRAIRVKERLRLERQRREVEAPTRACVVCGKPVRRGRVTCGGSCADARLARDRVAHQRHRISQATSILRRPEVKAPAEVRWARRMVGPEPPPPNRRFTQRGSRAAQAVRELEEAA